jgi:hypothetical protein
MAFGAPAGVKPLKRCVGAYNTPTQGIPTAIRSRCKETGEWALRRSL